MDIFEAIEKFRKSAFDPVVSWVPISALEVTRLSGWFCFLTAIELLLDNVPFALGFLVLGLLLDGLDGAVARRRGLGSPEVDWASDRFTEFAIFSAYLVHEPGWLPWCFLVVFLVNVVLPYGKIRVLPARHVFAGVLGLEIILAL